MRIEKTAGGRRAWKHVLALWTLLVAALLIYQAVAAYRAGVSPENMRAPGVFDAPIFSPAGVAERFSAIAVPVWGWMIAMALSLIAAPFFPSAASAPVRVDAEARAHLKDRAAAKARPLGALRIALYVAALSLIALGVLNGGMRDVLVKAINICTECIGLG